MCLQNEGEPKEITDIAAQVLSLQPTGYTLSTTQVCHLAILDEY